MRKSPPSPGRSQPQPPLSVRASKAAIAAQSSALADGMTNAATHADATFDSNDYAEGRTAFMEKRPPRFIGK
jgi:enoyl-CoA hydratase/carnithine racemase